MSARVRVFLRGKRFYVRYSVGGIHDIATGILSDIPAPPSISHNPDWWKASMYAPEIETFVREAESMRDLAIRKRQRDRQTKKKNKYLELYRPKEPFPVLPHAPVTLETILETHTVAIGLRRERGKLSSGTIERRQNALRLLRKFDARYDYSKIDTEWLLRFREWAEKHYKGTTLTGYLTDIRAIVQYGIEEGLLPAGKNKFLDINFRAVYEPARKTPWSDEERLYRFLYAENRPLFDQVVFQRLTGFRVTWVAGLLEDEIDIRQGVITSLNRKAGRMEDFPIIRPLAWLLGRKTGPYDKFAFKYRDRNSVYSNLQRACKYAGVSGFGTHQLKKNYSSEWRRETSDPDVIAFLSHHATHGVTRLSREIYVDPEEIMEVASATLDRAQTKRWMAFFQSLKGVRPSGETYRWSNEKGDWKKRIKVAPNLYRVHNSKQPRS